jgi:hypothetical protein
MDDPLFALAAIFPLLIAAAGVGFILHGFLVPTAADVESDVLEALSHDEALPLMSICARAPLKGQRINPEVVHFALEHLRRTGRAVRWYAEDEEVVYRRVA